MGTPKKYSDAAWEVAAQYADILASDTRGLAGAIDDALAAERERIAKIFDLRAAEHEKSWNNCASDGHRNASVWRDKMYEMRGVAAAIRNAQKGPPGVEDMKVRVIMLTGQMEYPWSWRWTVGGKTFGSEKAASEHAKLLSVLEESLDQSL